MSSERPEPGRAGSQGLVAGRFHIRGVVGRGGMGTVYLAQDQRDGTLVALKTLHLVAPASLLRLKEEFRALSDVLHPNLVRLQELYVDPAEKGDATDPFWCFFTMEYVPGRHLIDQLCRRPEAAAANPTWQGDEPPGRSIPTLDTPLPGPRASSPPLGFPAALDEVAEVFGQLAAAVDALHRQGKLHRDIKSANVILAPTPHGTPRVVVLDFGLVLESGAAADVVAGTPATMAPEQMRGEAVGPAADWYAVGVHLYEALTSRPPFGGDFDGMIWAKSGARYPPLADTVDPAWARLCRALLTPDPRHRAGAAEILAVAKPAAARTRDRRGRAREALIGRAHERAQLRAAWARVCGGEPASVFVRGRSGIGKTALVGDFLAELGRDPANLLLTGRCHEREQIPHKALDAVIDALSRHLHGLSPGEVAPLVPRHATSLARLFPVLARHPAFETDEAVPADPRVVRAFGAVALEDLLGRLARRWHVVIAIDDLQWGDGDSAALLARLLQSDAPPPLLLLGSHRDEDEANSPMLQALAPFRSGIAENGLAVRRIEDLQIGPLREDDARVLLAAGGNAVDERLLAEAAGDPYLLAEAAAWERTDLEVDGDGAVIPHFAGVPEMLRLRLDAVPRGVRELVEAVAVAGRPTPVAFLPTTSEDRRGDVRHAVQLRLLRIHGDSSAEKLDCYHDQVRMAAVTHLSPERRTALHTGLASALEAAEGAAPGTVDAEALAMHWEGAGHHAEAATWVLRAARIAEDALAFAHAASLYRRFLDLTAAEATDRRVERESAELRLAETLAQSGDGRAAADAFLAAAVTQPGEALVLRTRAAQELMMSGHLQAGLAIAKKVLAEVDVDFHASQLRAVLATLWQRLRVRVRGMEPSPQVPADSPLLRQLDVCWAMVTGLHSIDPIRSSAFVAQHTLLSLQAGEPRRIARSYAAEAASVSIGGEKNLAQGLALAARAEAMAVQLNDPHLLALTAQERGTLYFMCGHWREAEADFKKALTILAAHCPGAVWERSTCELFLMDQYIYLGDMDRIEERANRILRDGAAAGNLYKLTIAMRPLHIVRLAADEPERARRELELAVAGWPGEGRVQHFNANWALAQTELYDGRAEEALARTRTLWVVLRWAMLLTMEYIRIEVRHTRGRALLATAVPLEGAARAHSLKEAERDAHALLKERGPWAHPLGLLIRAGVANLRGGDPMTDLHAALRSFEAQGMALYAAATRRRIAERAGDQAGVDRAYTGLKVVNPQKMTGMLAPGLGNER